MKKGILKHKNNNWFIRTVETGRELDEIKFEYYPIAFSESRDIELIEGLEVEFEIKNVLYTDTDGVGETLIKWGVIL
jgi:hypothetical protein